MKHLILSLIAMIFTAATVFAQTNYAPDVVGPVKIGEVKDAKNLEVPFITWGGDMATFHANGGLKTKSNTIFNKMGLNITLTPGDNFIQQVRDYLAGKRPFLRGTARMMGAVSEVIGSDPRTKGVMIMQMTWSQGDHLVSRADIKKITDLKGKTVVLYNFGPHLGLIEDILETAKMTWDDINVIWAKDFTGTDNSPAAIFRKNKDVAACCVITPDMVGLTGGMQNIGSGAEGTVKGAKVLDSTAQLSRSIADVYVCRKDFYDKHKDVVANFVAGYLKACEEVIELKKQYESKGSKEYEKLLEMTQNIYGKEVIPTLEDAHGLLLDCKFVGYPGNVVFFTDKNNSNGFEAYQKSSLDLAINRGYAKIRCGLFASDLNYKSETFLKNLTKTKIEKKEKFKAEAVLDEIEALNNGGDFDSKTIHSFTIEFEPNQTEFSIVQYGAEFAAAIKMAKKYGNAALVIKGHSDPTKVLVEAIRAGMAKGILRKSGSRSTGYKYFLNGKSLSLEDTKTIVSLISEGMFDGTKYNPRRIMQAAMNLSRQRVENVKNSIIKYAKENGNTIDKSQIQIVGVGVKEPLIPKPKNGNEAKQNMRVEFSLIKINAESIEESDFDY